MIFKQYENGSCDIEFSWRERLIILKKGKLHLSDKSLKHFGTKLVGIVADWHLKFNDELKKENTFKDIKTEGN